MRSLPLLLLAWCGFAWGEDAPVRIVSWNLQWFPGKYPAARPEEQVTHLSEAAKALAVLKPRIICLQEIKTKDAAESLISGLVGFKIDVISDFPKQFGSAQQLIVASDLKAVAASWQTFRATAQEPPRGFVQAIYRMKGRLVVVYCVHLKSNRGGIEANIGKREESARQILEHVELTRAKFAKQGEKHIAFVIAGDFNTDDRDKRFGTEATVALLKEAGFRSGWRAIPFERRVTWPSDGKYPDACFDHLYFRGITTLPVARAWPELEGVSDHLPISADLR